MYLYGGVTKKFATSKYVQQEGDIQGYNSYSEKWRWIPTRGTPPSGLFRHAAACFDNIMYTYGGHRKRSYSASLHQLDTRSYMWTELSSQHENGPMMKSGCGMIYYDKSLLICGGIGIPFSSLQKEARFLCDGDYGKGVGFTNEIHMFHIVKGMI